jgi:RimJ/RimL family protein N-acetyltransferase
MRNPVKVGSRVYLRPLEPADARDLAIASHIERETAHRASGRVPASAIAFEASIRKLAGTHVPAELLFAICRRDDDRFLGTVRLGRIDWVNRTAETGTGLLAAEDRGKGIGTEAKHLLLDHAFLDLGLHALHAIVYAGNARSAAALARQGYRLAGRLTADLQRGGGFEDTLVFDITRADWERARAGWRDEGVGPAP